MTGVSQAPRDATVKLRGHQELKAKVEEQSTVTVVSWRLDGSQLCWKSTQNWEVCKLESLLTFSHYNVPMLNLLRAFFFGGIDVGITLFQSVFVFFLWWFLNFLKLWGAFFWKFHTFFSKSVYQPFEFYLLGGFIYGTSLLSFPNVSMVQFLLGTSVMLARLGLGPSPTGSMVGRKLSLVVSQCKWGSHYWYTPRL